jgi:hypothetical protein
MVNVDGSLIRNTLEYDNETFSSLYYRHLTNLSLAWFDPIRPQDFIIVDQSSALLACVLCGESEMSMSDVGKNMAGSPFWGCREMVNV